MKALFALPPKMLYVLGFEQPCSTGCASHVLGQPDTQGDHLALVSCESGEEIFICSMAQHAKRHLHHQHHHNYMLFSKTLVPT